MTAIPDPSVKNLRHAIVPIPLVSQADLARMLGISRSAVNASLSCGMFRPAKVGHRVNLADDSLIEWALKNPFPRDKRGLVIYEEVPAEADRLCYSKDADGETYLDIFRPASAIYAARMGWRRSVEAMLDARDAQAEIFAIRQGQARARRDDDTEAVEAFDKLLDESTPRFEALYVRAFEVMHDEGAADVEHANRIAREAALEAAEHEDVSLAEPSPAPSRRTTRKAKP